MRKIIKISGNEYSIKSSAWTSFKYQNDTGRNLLDDIHSLKDKIKDKSEEEMLAVLQDMLDVVYKITYTMITEADEKQAPSYESFLKSLDNVMEDSSWLLESLECAIAPLSGGTKKDSPQIEQ